MAEDDDQQADAEEESETSYPEVDVTIRLVDDDDDGIEGLRVSLGDSHGTTWGGEDLYTDSDGEVTITVRAWKTYDLWVDHEKFDEVGVAGESDTFEFTWGDDDEDDDGDDES